MTDMMSVTKKTRQKANSNDWFNARKCRLTASNFGKILKRKSLPTDKFLNTLFNSKEISAPSLDYGKRHENIAKAKYLEVNKNCHFHECGLVVNKNFAFLGATPDGELCDNGECGTTEVKCPFTARHMKIVQACDEVRDFCLENNNGVIQLKKIS